MVTSIEMICAPTKFQTNEHQKLPSKKPIVAMDVLKLIRCLVYQHYNVALYRLYRLTVSIWTMN